MPDTYSSQYREMVLAQVRAGRSVYDLAEGLEVSAATIFRWKRQDQIDSGNAVGLSSQELAAVKRASELFLEGTLRLSISQIMASSSSPASKFRADVSGACATTGRSTTFASANEATRWSLVPPSTLSLLQPHGDLARHGTRYGLAALTDEVAIFRAGLAKSESGY